MVSDTSSSKKILILGANSALGRHIAESIAERHPEGHCLLLVGNERESLEEIEANIERIVARNKSGKKRRRRKSKATSCEWRNLTSESSLSKRKKSEGVGVQCLSAIQPSKMVVRSVGLSKDRALQENSRDTHPDERKKDPTSARETKLLDEEFPTKDHSPRKEEETWLEDSYANEYHSWEERLGENLETRQEMKIASSRGKFAGTKLLSEEEGDDGCSLMESIPLNTPLVAVRPKSGGGLNDINQPSGASPLPPFSFFEAACQQLDQMLGGASLNPEDFRTRDPALPFKYDCSSLELVVEELNVEGRHQAGSVSVSDNSVDDSAQRGGGGGRGPDSSGREDSSSLSVGSENLGEVARRRFFTRMSRVLQPLSKKHNEHLSSSSTVTDKKNNVITIPPEERELHEQNIRRTARTRTRLTKNSLYHGMKEHVLDRMALELDGGCGEEVEYPPPEEEEEVVGEPEEGIHGGVYPPASPVKAGSLILRSPVVLSPAVVRAAVDECATVPEEALPLQTEFYDDDNLPIVLENVPDEQTDDYVIPPTCHSLTTEHYAYNLDTINEEVTPSISFPTPRNNININIIAPPSSRIIEDSSGGVPSECLNTTRFFSHLLLLVFLLSLLFLLSRIILG